MWVVFTKASPYIKRARFLAIGWTLLIFILCFIPGNELPRIDIPFIDKWTHVILFAGFSFFWLCAAPTTNAIRLLAWLLLAIFIGWLVEYIQGHYVTGRFQDDMDTVADAVGGLVGILIFVVGAFIARGKIGISKR